MRRTVLDMVRAVQSREDGPAGGAHVQRQGVPHLHVGVDLLWALQLPKVRAVECGVRGQRHRLPGLAPDFPQDRLRRAQEAPRAQRSAEDPQEFRVEAVPAAVALDPASLLERRQVAVSHSLRDADSVREFRDADGLSSRRERADEPDGALQRRDFPQRRHGAATTDRPSMASSGMVNTGMPPSR